MGSLLDSMRLIIESKRPADQIFIERFLSADKINKVQDFTADKELLLAGRRQLRIEQGQTAVVDGLYVAVDHVARNSRPDGRKAVVLITDGEDRQSYYSTEKLVELLHKTEVPVFVIGVTSELDKAGGLIRKSPRDRAEKLLKTIAEESRGRLFLVKNVPELEKATAEIVHDLQRQYSLGYYSTTDPGTSDFRKVEVKIVPASKDDKRKVIAQRGYWLKPPSWDQKSKEKKSP
jgi:Ca-activated chloride channel family protein